MDSIAQEKYGSCIFKDVSDYVCVDLETTGLKPREDAIIEIGAVKVSDNAVVDTFQTFVDPGFRIPRFITELTGISTSMVFGAPAIKEALSSFLEFAGTDILVGHNIHCFDIKFLQANAQKALNLALQNDYFDTLRLARRLYSEAKHNGLAELIIRLNVAEREEHRALSDALQTVDVYNAMKRVMSERGITCDDIRPRCRNRSNSGSSREEFDAFGFRKGY